MIDNFQGINGFLSNFSPHPVKFAGRVWRTSEHAFQASKTLDPYERNAIFDAPTPYRAKQLGRGATMREDWEQIRVPVMESIVCAKFLGDPALGARLVGTGERILVEGNTWGDRFWGAVWAEEVGDGERIWSLPKENTGKVLTGRNELGMVLMRVRDLLASNARFHERLRELQSFEGLVIVEPPVPEEPPTLAAKAWRPSWRRTFKRSLVLHPSA